MNPPNHRPTKFLPGAPAELWCMRNFRKRDRTGDEIGMFVVTGYVGNNWRTSEYARFRCRECGKIGTCLAKRLDALKRRTCACQRGENASRNGSATPTRPPDDVDVGISIGT